MDEIQDHLVRWLDEGDRSAGDVALRLLMAEWGPKVRGFLGQAAYGDAEEWLQDALVAKATPARDGSVAVRAPEGAKARSYRAAVLMNFLRDKVRRREARRRFKVVQGGGWGRDTAAEMRERPGADRAEELGIAPPAATGHAPDVEALECWFDVEQVLDVALHLPPKRRLVLELRLGAEPSDPPDLLAKTVGVPREEVEVRLARWRENPTDEKRQAAVLYGASPEGPETFRRTLARAASDVRARLQGGGG